MTLPPLRALLVALPLSATACVENAVHEQTEHKLAEARAALAQKDTEIRAYQWQAATLTQQLQEAQQRSDALQRDLLSQLQQLTTSNAALGERLKKVEGERAALILASSSEPSPSGRDLKTGPRPEELRRMIAAADARNAIIVEELARIEKLLTGAAAAAPPPRPPAVEAAGGRDVVDPWGFGSRK